MMKSTAIKLQIAVLILFIGLVACKKESEPIPQDTVFEIKYSSSGIKGVNANFGFNEKSYADATTNTAILTGTLGSSADGQLKTSVSYRKEDKVYAYVVFKDIENPNAVPPSANGFLAASLYINGEPRGVLRLSYNDYYSTQHRYIDSSGKVNLIIESIVTVL